MNDAVAAPPPRDALAWRRLAASLILGFASGLPLALSGTALQAWLTVAGLDVSTIGFLTLIGLPYTFKFLWAPLMDRWEPPLLGRRRGWIVVCQLGLVVSLFVLSYLSPANIGGIGAVAAFVAFLSASQDVVIDAWRTDTLSAAERGHGASTSVLGYRLAMVLSGGIALIWADPAQGGMTWPEVYRKLAVILAIAGAIGVAVAPPAPARPATAGEPPMRQELLGFLAVAAAAVLGWFAASYPGAWLGHTLVAPLGFSEKVTKGGADLVALALGVAVALPTGAQLAKRLGYATLTRSLEGFLAQPHARALLLAVVLFKLGDAFCMALNTTFLLKGAGFTSAQVGVVNKVFGIWLTVVGSLIGGIFLPRLGLVRALVGFGALQAVAVLGFFFLSLTGAGALGAFEMPPFDLGVVWLKESVTVDGGMLAAVALENVTSGMGTAAFVALLMSLSASRFSATQYALVSALAALGRVWVGPFAGVIAETAGWPTLFFVGFWAGWPGVWMVWRLRETIAAMAGEGSARG